MSMKFTDIRPQVFPEAAQAQAQVMLCSGVPWDKEYHHVRKFNTRDELNGFLMNTRRISVNECSFIDVNKMSIVIPYNQMQAYQCNYMVWRNTPWSNEEHYAFITDIKPRGANCCEILFEQDVWTECQFDLTFHQCFVERSHVSKAQDQPGRYTYPEGLQLGEIVVNGTDHRLQIPTREENYSDGVWFACAYEYDENNHSFKNANVEPYQGVWTGVAYDKPENPQQYISDLIDANKIDGLIDAWQMPDTFADSDLVTKVFTMNKKYDNIDGYVPKNKKLFTYPYNYLLLSNNSGQTKEYHYERFNVPQDKNKVQFYYTMALSPSPTLYCYPTDYKGMDLAYSEAITYSNYPKVAVAVDSYKAWLAQNSNNLLVSMATGNNLPATPLEWAGRAVSTLADLGASGGLSSTINGVLGVLSGNYKAEIGANGIKGSIGNATPHAVGFDHISVYPVSITSEYARIIDEFFTMYGYKICRVITPNITNRSSWNYIKTQNCVITGGWSYDILRKLRAIFDNGVTVWHTNKIGDYNRDND